MDFQHIVTNDQELLTALLDGQGELKARQGAGLDSLGGGGGTEGPSIDLDRMREGAYYPGESGGIEAIVLRFMRPVFLVQGSTVAQPGDTTAILANGESAVISSRLSAAKQFLDAAIPGVGRINLTNHSLDCVDSGWMVHPEIAVTNRHVAEYFGARDGEGFRFRSADKFRAELWVAGAADQVAQHALTRAAP